jgi:hypothetical protein
MRGSKLNNELPSSHVGHHDVGHDDIDGGTARRGFTPSRETFLAGPRLDDRVAFFLKGRRARARTAVSSSTSSTRR